MFLLTGAETRDPRANGLAEGHGDSVRTRIDLALAEQMIRPRAGELARCLLRFLQLLRFDASADLQSLRPGTDLRVPMLGGEVREDLRRPSLDLGEDAGPEIPLGAQVVPGDLVCLGRLSAGIDGDEDRDRDEHGQPGTELPVALDELVEEGRLAERGDGDLGGGLVLGHGSEAFRVFDGGGLRCFFPRACFEPGEELALEDEHREVDPWLAGAASLSARREDTGHMVTMLGLEASRRVVWRPSPHPCSSRSFSLFLSRSSHRRRAAPPMTSSTPRAATSTSSWVTSPRSSRSWTRRRSCASCGTSASPDSSPSWGIPPIDR